LGSATKPLAASERLTISSSTFPRRLAAVLVSSPL
jgi:hypothetical protein